MKENEKTPQRVEIINLPQPGVSIVSWVALIVSFASALISLWSAVYQARISQLPAVSVYFRWDVPVPEPDRDPYSTVQWKIENTGNGPAVVHSAKLFVPTTGKSYDMGSDEAWNMLRSLLAEHFQDEVVGYNTDPVAPGYAIARESEWSLFEVSFQNTDETLVRTAEVVTLAICHCSVASGECQSDDSDSNPNNILIEDCPKRTNVAKLLRRS